MATGRIEVALGRLKDMFLQDPTRPVTLRDAVGAAGVDGDTCEILLAALTELRFIRRCGAGPFVYVRSDRHHADAEDARHPAPVVRPSSSGAPHILIVDRDADTRSLYREALADRATIDEAPDGADAIAKALLQPPTLVVTEIRLPHVDGYTFCTTLRADVTTCDTKILIVTASAFEATIGCVAGAGADAVLLKPCPIDVLCARVDGLLGERGIRGVRSPALPYTAPTVTLPVPAVLPRVTTETR